MSSAFSQIHVLGQSLCYFDVDLHVDCTALKAVRKAL